jgi:hypothetical protein
VKIPCTIISNPVICILLYNKHLKVKNYNIELNEPIKCEQTACFYERAAKKVRNKNPNVILEPACTECVRRQSIGKKKKKRYLNKNMLILTLYRSDNNNIVTAPTFNMKTTHVSRGHFNRFVIFIRASIKYYIIMQLLENKNNGSMRKCFIRTPFV